MQQQMQLQQLESEIARLQVELRQVRQMIGSLIRNEQETRQLYENATVGRGNFPIPQFIQQQNQAMHQFEQMRSTSDHLHRDLNQLAQSMPGQAAPMTARGYEMNPMSQDPMQRRFQ
jgi:predicted RNase H-like nuclease (RuvC/YqgF family)